MKLVILPLDSRPCTCDFPQQLALAGGLSPCVPGPDLMDWYRSPSDFRKISSWLETACQGADVCICSLDQLAYGGLLASREMSVSAEQALERVNFLRSLKARYPSMSIFLSSVIMRTTVSTLRQEDVVWWEKVALYSRLAARSDPGSQEQRAELERQIPAQVLQTFLWARARNHQVNQEAVRLLSDGVVQEVCFLQEDSAPQGMHRAEQAALQELAERGGVADRMSIHCGTDEYACALAGRLAAQHARPEGPALRLYVEWLAGDPDFVAGYEDRPFARNLEAYLKTCHILQTDDLSQAQAILAVYAPPGQQMDLAIAPEQAVCAYTPAQLDKIADRLCALESTGLDVGLLDVYFAGGGESQLLRLAAGRGLLDGLTAYAGWNTASNSLGTILGQLLAASTRARPGAITRFTRERLLDDWVYQAIVRPRWNRELRDADADPWNLPDIGAADRHLQAMMEQTPETSLAWDGPFCARLRWPRTFEASFSIQDKGVIP